jgi:hypothetical protein
LGVWFAAHRSVVTLIFAGQHSEKRHTIRSQMLYPLSYERWLPESTEQTGAQEIRAFRDHLHTVCGNSGRPLRGSREHLAEARAAGFTAASLGIDADSLSSNLT